MARRWIPRLVVLALAAAAVWWWRQCGSTPWSRSSDRPRRRRHPRLPRHDCRTDAPRQADDTEPTVEPPTARATGRVGVRRRRRLPRRLPGEGGPQSGIFHVPGGRFYDRTVPERCYATAAAAEADGYRRAKA